ncbi:MAG: tRNA 5-hydroxyuridine modification protein YegQ [Alcanivoracaceae bacterium]|nr:tRNA 5-hydroxyuridine modification protein YegQ [Alcanivoracaceae bacterium]
MAADTFTPELLSPAGTMTHLKYAFAYGADAVYAGQPRYSLRVRNNSFKNAEALAEGIDYAHARGKQFYLASNISPHNDKVRSYLRDLAPIIELGPDALIMSDPGLIMLVKEQWPDQEIHLSVQANAVNWATVKFWHQQGISRVILSRELALEEVAEIRERVPDMELEVFVHGALCMAYSGRCLLSGYMNHRDANQGACTNACRWDYKTVEHNTDSSGDMVPRRAPIPVKNEGARPQTWQPGEHDEGGADSLDGLVKAAQSYDPFEVKELLLEDPKQPGEFVPVYEDEHGTYIMNSRDLRAVQHVKDLLDIGVHSLKIEGRTKSPYYVARTAQIYRRAIDDAVAGKDFDMGLMDQLEALSSRGYTEGFFRRHPPQEFQTYEQGTSTLGTEQLVGEVIDADDQWLTVDVKNRFKVGDHITLMSPAGNQDVTLETLENRKGEAIEVAPGNGHIVRIPRGSELASTEYCLLTRHL